MLRLKSSKYFFVVIIAIFHFHAFATSNFAKYIPRVFLFGFHPKDSWPNPTTCSLRFTTFSLFLRMGELCNDSYKYQLLNKSGDNLVFCMKDLTFALYLKNFLVLSVVEVFENIRFLPRFYKFGKWLRCVLNISDVYYLSLPNIDIFTHESRLSFPKKFGALHRKRFQKNRLFSTFFAIVYNSKVCNIWDK